VHAIVPIAAIAAIVWFSPDELPAELTEVTRVNSRIQHDQNRA
jgi:hypothetical protein